MKHLQSIDEVSMKTPERSVEDFEQKFGLRFNNPDDVPLQGEVQDWLTQILQAERQRREVVVEAIETIRQLVTDIYESGREGDTEDWTDDLLKHIYKLTKPNNNK